MNRIMTAQTEEPLSKLMGTLSIMGFAAECNLRDVAEALGQRNLAGFGRVLARNAKQARLRAEIEEQIVEEMALPTVGTRSRRKLILTSQIGLMFERFGAETVEISELCAQLLRHSRPTRLNEIKKLIEHAIYITDRAIAGLVNEDGEMAKIAIEQKLAAQELNNRINRDLAFTAEGEGEGAARADLLCRISCKTFGIIEQSERFAQDIVAFLEKGEI